VPSVLSKAEIQRLRSLREKKHREALGLFVVEGEKVVAELLAARFPFAALYATDAAALAAQPLPPDLPVHRIDAETMARISHFPTPSPLLAVGRLVRRPLAPADLARGLTLALDGLQDPGNVGTLLRLADWFAFDRVVLSPDSADLFHQKVINASMGSFARVRTHTAELPTALAAVRAFAPALPILGCDLSGRELRTLPALADAVIVIGSEGRGLSPGVQATLTATLTIPRFGAAESLNAATAAAIVCHHLRTAPPSAAGPGR
jgi:TrmH family RNA methyltransferase